MGKLKAEKAKAKALKEWEEEQAAELEADRLAARAWERQQAADMWEAWRDEEERWRG